MNDFLTNVNVGAIVAVPIIIAIVQAVKTTGYVPSKFAPLVSIIIGIGVSFIANHENNDLSQNLMHGVVYGLMASGLYSGVKTTINSDTETKRINPKY